MPPQLFVFIQFEFPWTLGPPDGRYLLRRSSDGEPERVVVLSTLGAARADDPARAGGRARGIVARGRRREPSVPAEPQPAAVQTTRVTSIDPVSLSADSQARAWLEQMDREREVEAAVAVVNRVLHAHRIATADPYLHELAPAQALAIRAGWGEGEQVADGRWAHARALSLQAARGARGSPRRRDRSAALRPQERLAELLGARGAALLCEELALRARADLDQGRLEHAALELERALELAPRELRAEQREDLALRIAELEQLRAGVQEQAQLALAAAATATHEAQRADEDTLRHALERLEAALRARSAKAAPG